VRGNGETIMSIKFRKCCKCVNEFFVLVSFVRRSECN